MKQTIFKRFHMLKPVLIANRLHASGAVSHAASPVATGGDFGGLTSPKKL